MKKYIFWTTLIIFSYGIIEAVSYGSLLWLKKNKSLEFYPPNVISERHAKIINGFIEGNTKYYSHSPILGWTIKKNGASRLYQANSSGIRSNREYEIAPPQDILRISAFGDSFTHSDDVKNDETWQSYLESWNSNMEVMNFGVGGYGLDQAYLRYLEDGRQFKSNIVLIGFMSENIFRNVNTFRPFYYSDTGIPLTKPRFKVNGDKLILIKNGMKNLQDYRKLFLYPKKVVTRLGKNDHYFKKYFLPGKFDWLPSVRLYKVLMQTINDRINKDDIVVDNLYNKTSEAFNVTATIFDEFYKVVKNDNAKPIIILFPRRADLKRFRRENIKTYSPLIKYFESKGYAYIDIIDAFENEDLKSLYSGHYSPYANRLVAKHINNYISKFNTGKNDN